MQGNVVTGAGYVMRGAKMLALPSLRLFVLITLLVNVLIFATLIGFGLGYIVDFVDRWLDWLPEWLNFLEWILWPLVGLAVSLTTGYLFTAVALIIASPFNALLAEKAEELITGKPVDSLEGLGPALMALPRGILRELAKLVYYVPMALFVLLMTLWMI